MTYQQNFGFGSGVMFGTPLSGTNLTPVRLGILQDVSVDFAFTTKQLFGQYQFPVAIGRGTAKVTGKAKFARIDAGALASLYFNTATTAGQILIADAEAHAIPGTPYQVTVTLAADTPLTDLGVNYATTGQPLTKVSSGPTVGQYSVNISTGVYTFAAADTAANVLINYSYTLSGSGGTTTTITNPVLGSSTPFQVDFYQLSPNSTQQWGLRLFSCMSSKLTLSTKLEDFTIPEFDFEAFANGSNQIGTINLPTN
jgi:hypothetical protein